MSWRVDWGAYPRVKITYDPGVPALAENLRAEWDSLSLSYGTFYWPPIDLTPEFNLFLTRIPAMPNCPCSECRAVDEREKANYLRPAPTAGALNGQRKAHPLSPLTNHEIMCSCADCVARFDNYKREAITIGTCGIDPAAQQGRDARVAMAAAGPGTQSIGPAFAGEPGNVDASNPRDPDDWPTAAQVLAGTTRDGPVFDKVFRGNSFGVKLYDPTPPAHEYFVLLQTEQGARAWSAMTREEADRMAHALNAETGLYWRVVSTHD